MISSPSRNLILAVLCFIAALFFSIYASRSNSSAKQDSGKRLALEIFLPNHNDLRAGACLFLPYFLAIP